MKTAAKYYVVSLIDTVDSLETAGKGLLKRNAEGVDGLAIVKGELLHHELHTEPTITFGAAPAKRTRKPRAKKAAVTRTPVITAAVKKDGTPKKKPGRKPKQVPFSSGTPALSNGQTVELP